MSALKRFTYDWLIRFMELMPENASHISSNNQNLKITAVSPLFTQCANKYAPYYIPANNLNGDVTYCPIRTFGCSGTGSEISDPGLFPELTFLCYLLIDLHVKPELGAPEFLGPGSGAKIRVLGPGSGGSGAVAPKFRKWLRIQSRRLRFSGSGSFFTPKMCKIENCFFNCKKKVVFTGKAVLTTSKDVAKLIHPRICLYLNEVYLGTRQSSTDLQFLDFKHIMSKTVEIVEIFGKFTTLVVFSELWPLVSHCKAIRLGMDNLHYDENMAKTLADNGPCHGLRQLGLYKIPAIENIVFPIVDHYLATTTEDECWIDLHFKPDDNLNLNIPHTVHQKIDTSYFYIQCYNFWPEGDPLYCHFIRRN
uniref:F-box associated domain-containing protein n=1 Tax=Panagrellus redivivus TaxID=6233 RepID=A0A7E4V958_PANRE